MKIPAILSDASAVSVSAEELDELVKKNFLLAINRSDGWAVVGIDEMRDPGGRRGTSRKDRKNLSSPKSERDSNS
ncbi:MAG: hypothetical protein ACYDHC_08955 [Desulfuromonadaceae bacterium]